MADLNGSGAPSPSPHGAPDQGSDTEVAEAAAAEEYAPAASSRRLEIIIALIALGLSVLFLVLANHIELRQEVAGIGPRWWPQVLGISGIVISSALLLSVLFRPPFSRDEVESLTGQGLTRALAAAALSVGFILIWPTVGFEVSAVVFLVAVTSLFGGRGWRTLIIFPVVTVAFIYVLFHLVLKVPL